MSRQDNEVRGNPWLQLRKPEPGVSVRSNIDVVEIPG
jgi:hypothetical protein